VYLLIILLPTLKFTDLIASRKNKMNVAKH